MAELRVIDTRRPRQEAVVEKLEQALERARAGEISAIAIVTVRFDGAANSSFTACENGVTMLGAIDLLRFRYVSNLASE